MLRHIGFLLGFSTALCSPTIAQDAASYKCTVSCSRELAREALRVEPGAYDTARAALAKPDLSSIVETAATKFHSKTLELSAQVGALKNVQRGYEKSFALISDIPMGDELPLSFLSANISHGLDDQIDQLESRRHELAGQILGPALAEIRSKHGATLDDLRGASPAVVHDTLFGTDGLAGLFSETEAGKLLGVEGRADLANVKADLVHHQLEAVSSGLVTTSAKVDALVGDYVAFKGRMEQFADSTKSKMNSLADGQRHLLRVYETLAVAVEDNTFRLDALEGAMWGKLSAKERIAALEGGAFASVINRMPADKKQGFRDDLAFAAKLEDINNTAGVIGQVANDFQKIGALVGVDISEPISHINKAVVAVQSIVSIASMNPIGIISGLGGLAGVFGGSGNSDGVSAALVELRRDIQQMRKEMYEYHVREMEALKRISDQIDKRFSQLAALQGSTLDQIGFNTKQLNESLLSGLNACRTIMLVWPTRAGESFDNRAARFNANFQKQFADCRDGINDRLFVFQAGQDLAISTVFSLQALGDASPDTDLGQEILNIQRYRDETLRPVVGYTLREQPVRSTKAECEANVLAFRALLASPKRDDDILAAATREKEACEASDEPPGSASPNIRLDTISLLGAPISAKSILFHGRSVLAVSKLYEFVDAPGAVAPRFKAIRELTGQDVNESTLRLELPRMQLQVVLDLVNLAIAQINVLGGDLILEVLTQDIEAAIDDPARANLAEVDAVQWADCSAMDKPSARYFNALCVLKRNEVLRSNFARHWVRTRLANETVTARIRYAVGLTEATPEVLLRSFKRKMPIEKCNSDFCLRLPGAKIADPNPSMLGKDGSLATHFDLTEDFLIKAPSWDEVATDRQAVASPIIHELIAFRQEVINRLAEIETNKDLTAEERGLVEATVVLQLAEGRAK